MCQVLGSFQALILESTQPNQPEVKIQDNYKKQDQLNVHSGHLTIASNQKIGQSLAEFVHRKVSMVSRVL